ncbi:MAG: capsid assembly protein [Minwuia sp.]|uniref:capsid assembly protein n=1 Tax=Minwuia sp. TaxID=2493630 RepID=UPI003A869358
MNTSMIDYSAAAAGGESAARRVAYRGKDVEIPEMFWDAEAGEVNLPALLKSHRDLRRKVSAQTRAPAAYEIRLPDDLGARRKIDPEDPLAAAAMDWAKRNNLPQAAFDELVETFVRQDAEMMDPDRFRDLQMSALKERFGHRCDEVCKDVGHWFGALMQPDFEAQPELREAAEELASDARGVMLLKAIRDRLTERGVPGNAPAASAAMDETALRRLQASEPYLNSRHPDHEATARRVREGWQSLIGRG